MRSELRPERSDFRLSPVFLKPEGVLGLGMLILGLKGLNRGLNGPNDGWTDELTNGRMDRRTDRRTDGQTD